jgi:acyl-CoA hydrolase
MEVELNVWAENPRAETRRKCNRAFYTFVALDEEGATVEIPSVEPETRAERERYRAAAKRRDIRLVIAGRKELEEADHLKEDMLTALQHAPDETE